MIENSKARCTMEQAVAHADTPVRLVTVMPIGPTCNPEFALDSLESVRHFVPTSRLIIVDDSGSGAGSLIARNLEVTVIETPQRGKVGGLYLNLSDGFLEALDAPFDVLLRLDTDALIAGNSFVAEAQRRFRESPKLGALGVHRFWYDGTPLHLGHARYSLLRWVRPTNSIRHPSRAVAAASLAVKVRMRSGTLGQCVFGGVCVYSRAALEALRDRKLLGRSQLAGLDMMEDHLFGALLTSVGFGLDDLGHGQDSLMGAAWRALPDHPEALLSAGRELIHSVRSWESMSETEVREVFASRRHQLRER